MDVDCCFSVLFRDGLRIVIEGECGGGGWTYTPTVPGRDGTDRITIIRDGAVDPAWGLV